MFSHVSFTIIADFLAETSHSQEARGPPIPSSIFKLPQYYWPGLRILNLANRPSRHNVVFDFAGRSRWP